MAQEIAAGDNRRMDIDTAATLAAITGIVTAIISLAVALFTQRSAATRDELNSLRETISHLQRENNRLSDRITTLEDERDAVRDWAERLVCQVRGAGLVPESYVEPKTEPRK